MADRGPVAPNIGEKTVEMLAVRSVQFGSLRQVSLVRLVGLVGVYLPALPALPGPPAPGLTP